MAGLNARLALKQAASVARRTGMRNRQVDVLRAIIGPHLASELEEIRRKVSEAQEAEDWQILRDWIEGFYPEQEERVAEALRPALLDFGERIADVAADEIGGEAEAFDLDEFTDEYLDAFRDRWARDSIAPVRAALRDMDGEELDDRLSGEFEDWEDSRADWTAEREATRSAAAYATATYAANGVQELVWRANPGACELCEVMDGRAVGITSSFLGAGEALEAGETRLVTEGSIGHPPLHGNRGRGGVCQCQIAAG